MKKFLLLALTAITALGLASCNRQEIDPPREGVQGKYLLTEITASTGDDDTKTAIQSNSVVNWSADDQIAVKGTDGALHYYKLRLGGGTPVGKFLPAPGQTPASYNTPADLTAIYPACAAELTDGELYVNINNQDLSGSFAEKGLTFWTADSPFTFINNDIKVAVPGGTTLEAGLPNFKFKQLGTCCSFIFDFTQADQAQSLMMESVERIQISTLNGVALGGRAKLSGTSLGPITNPVTNIDWTIASTKPMSALIQPTFVFYPGVTTNTTLKITLTTTDHEFVFTGKPTQDFEAGKRLTFPVTVDKNFTQGGTLLAYTSTLRTDMDQFYYYGGTNCLLLRTPNEIGYLDVTQYVTDSFWHNTKNTADVQNPRPASYARIIWSEGADVIASATVNGSAYDYKLKMADSAAGATDAISTDSSGKSFLSIKRGSAAGNALVGIYDASDKLLWSYHIWCPEDDPTDGMYEYTQTNSGSYTVMTMPIGALNKAYPGMPNPEKASGIFYQWGRKDPLGRKTNNSNNQGGGILLVKGPDQSTSLNIGDPDYGITGGNLKDCMIWLANDDGTESHNQLKIAHEASSQTKSLGRFIIDYSVSKPWMFICCVSDTFNTSNWTQRDDWLWGDGSGGSEYLTMEETYKSIFDPSPEGYRVSPKDLFVIFSRTWKTITSNSTSAQDMEVYLTDMLNADLSRTSSFVQPNNANGYAFYYQGWKSGPSDFYTTNGQRMRDGKYGDSIYASIFWKSGISGEKAGNLYIRENHFNPLASEQRVRGHNVRCVKER